MRLAGTEANRLADRLMAERYAYPTLLLMEAAGRAAAARLLQLYPHTERYILLCGQGNNGGDGYVVARELWRAGKQVWLITASQETPTAPEAATNHGICKALGLRMEVWDEMMLAEVKRWTSQGCVVIDALLGTGVQDVLRGQIASLMDSFRLQRCTLVALDIPTGLMADTGRLLNTPLQAERTLTFGLAKPCHYITPAAEYCGVVEVLDVGIYPEVFAELAIQTFLLTPQWIREVYKPRGSNTHKGTYGHVLLAGGSKGMPGSIALATQAVIENGAGLATAFIPGCVTNAFHRSTLEGMSIPYGVDSTPHLNDTASAVMATYLQGKDVLLIGPGLGQSPDTALFLMGVLEELANTEKPPKLVLDADALNLLASAPENWVMVPAGTVLTPHPGEMARLLGTDTATVQAARLEAAQELASQRQVVVVLKGQGTLIAAPDGTTYVCAGGNPGMATGGMGDVLAGAIAAWIAQGYDTQIAAALAVYLHAAAGDKLLTETGPEALTASKVLREMGPVLKDLVQQHTTWAPIKGEDVARQV